MNRTAPPVAIVLSLLSWSVEGRRRSKTFEEIRMIRDSASASDNRPIITVLHNLLNSTFINIFDWNDHMRPSLMQILSEGFGELETAELRAAAEHVQTSAQALIEAVDSAKAEDAAMHAFRLGCILHRLWVDRFAHSVEVGTRVIDGGKKGSQRAHGNTVDLRLRANEWQQQLNELLQRDSDLTYTRACAIIADKAGKSPRAVRRHVTNPRQDSKSVGKQRTKKS